MNGAEGVPEAAGRSFRKSVKGRERGDRYHAAMILSDGAHTALGLAGPFERRSIASLAAGDAALWRSLAGSTCRPGRQR